MGRYSLQRCLPIVFCVLLAGLLYWGWHYLTRPTTLPFHHVRVQNAVQHIDVQQVCQSAQENMEGGFFSLNVEKLKAVLLRQPWIMGVSIRRQWPDTLLLVIKERHAQARWGDEGVISSQAQLFYPQRNTIPLGLPKIVAPLVQKKNVLINFQSLSDDAQLLGQQIRVLQVNDRHVYQLTLSSGIVVMIGRDDVLARFHRFVTLYPQIISKRSDQVRHVDLQYPNGLAIRWKKKTKIMGK